MDKERGTGNHRLDDLSKLPPDTLQEHYNKKVDRLVESDAFKEEASGEPHYLEIDRDRMLELMGYRWADIANESGALSQDEVARARRSYYDIKEQFVELFGRESLPEEFRGKD